MDDDVEGDDPDDGEAWDFDREDKQAKAIELIESKDPGLVLVSPTCSPFSGLQEWNYPRMTAQSVYDHADAGVRHLAFSVLLCLIQHHRGRYFILEHPHGARS